MANFKSLNDLFKHLQTNVIPDVLENEVYSVVVETEQKMIEEHVYDAYSPASSNGEPWVYERRRYNGGLSDPRNMMASFYTVTGGYEMLVQNITKGSDDNFYIAPLIEYGDKHNGLEYQYKSNRDGTAWQYLRERNFTYQTMEELKKTLKHVEAFRKGLKRFGIRTYK